MGGHAPGEVRYPRRRVEIVEALDLLAKPYEPDPCWQDGRTKPPYSQFDAIFDLLVEELYWPDDDTVSHSFVGSYLRNEDEERAIYRLAPLLEAVYHEADKGGLTTDEEYQATLGWPAVVEAARNVRRVFTD